MFESTPFKVLDYAIPAFLFLVITSLAFRARWRASWLIGVAAVGLAFYVVSVARFIIQMPSGTFDFSNFWVVGRDLIEGRDPVERLSTLVMPPLNPPSSYPMFAALGALPLGVSYATWTVLNAAAMVLLVPIYLRVLEAREPGSTVNLGWPVLLAVAAALAVSNANRAGLQTGQLAIATTLALMAALLAQAAGRPIVAGVCLAVASLKINTMVPVLLLFLHRRDLRTWVAMIVVGVALTLLSGGRPVDTPNRVEIWHQNVTRLAAEGGINDFSFAGLEYGSNSDIVAFDHALFRIGLRSRPAIRAMNYLAVVMLGVWLARQIYGPRPIPAGAAAAMVGLYAMVFLYHRAPDLIFLGLPLLYCLNRVCGEPGLGRRYFAASAVAALAALFIQRKLLGSAQEWSMNHGAAGRMVQATILPYPLYAVLASMAFLWLGIRRSDPYRATITGSAHNLDWRPA